MVTKRMAAMGGLAVGWMLAGIAWAQVPAQPAVPATPAAPAFPAAPGNWPDSQRTQRELGELLRRYPPNLRQVLQLDPSLLGNATYLAPYPAVAAYLAQHSEIARNPSFYLGNPETEQRPDTSVQMADQFGHMLGDTLGATVGVLAMCLIAWLIKSFLDNRRWRNAMKVQTEAHTKLLDRMANNEDLLAYINSPAGSKYLQGAPLTLDAAPRVSVGAPLGRILWTVQGGVVLIAVGIGLEIVSRQSNYPVQEPLHALGILAAALGIGFVSSAIISFMISHRLGLIEHHRSISGRTTSEQG